MISRPILKKKLIEAGVRNLKEFGYPSVDKDNILTDEVYAEFFKSMLNDNKGKGVDNEIDELLEMIKKNLGQDGEDD